MSELRQRFLSESKRIVIKIGSRILVDSDQAGIRCDFISRLAQSIRLLRESGREVLLVTSGAVGAGMAALGLKEKPKDMATKQTCAAVGQIDLMHLYRAAFEHEKMITGQVLLSADDLRDRSRYKNLQNTIHAMLDLNVVPVINENDSVAVDEIKLGDNDKLSSDVALFIDADLLLIFTDEDGLFNENPKKNPQARLIDFVPKVDASVLQLAGKPGESGSLISTGGMHSKLTAIRAATSSGCNAFLANGMKVLPHEVILSDARGTLFAAATHRLNSRKRWLSFVSTPKGTILIDAGGCQALREKHSSLLPVGVMSMKGNFNRGDLIEVMSKDGERIARGIAQMDSTHLKMVLGMHSREIQKRLGSDFPEELIHKNDMMLL